MTSTEERIQQGILSTAHHDYENILRSHAFFKTNNHAMSEDLVQETFRKTWSYLVKGGKINVMKAFLYHVLNDLIIDEYRKHKTNSLDIMLEKGYQPSGASSEELLSAIDGKAAIILIQRLPDKYKKIMRMRYIQDMSLKEMSLITGQSKNAMAVQVHRGVEKLKLLYDTA